MTTFAPYRVHIATDEDGRYVIECPDSPGAVADGATPDEAIDRMREVIALWLAHDTGTEVDPRRLRFDYGA